MIITSSKSVREMGRDLMPVSSLTTSLGSNGSLFSSPNTSYKGSLSVTHHISYSSTVLEIDRQSKKFRQDLNHTTS